MPEAAARWPYGVGLAAAGLAILGMLYAPFAGIVYLLALPGVLFSAVWAWLHRSPARMPLVTAAGLLVLGFFAETIAFAVSRIDPSILDMGSHDWVAAAAFVILVALPGMSLLATIPFEIVGLRRPGVARGADNMVVAPR